MHVESAQLYSNLEKCTNVFVFKKYLNILRNSRIPQNLFQIYIIKYIKKIQ